MTTNSPTLTCENLLTVEDWREFAVNNFLSHQHANRAFQKKVRDENFTLFFINVFFYDMTPVRLKNVSILNSFMVEVTLYPKDDSVTDALRIEFSVDEGAVTVEQLEQRVHALYKSLDCQPDLHN